jgi:hypothetical protein
MDSFKFLPGQGKPEEILLVELILSDNPMRFFALKRGEKCYCWGLEDASESKRLRGLLNVVFFIYLFFNFFTIVLKLVFEVLQ